TIEDERRLAGQTSSIRLKGSFSTNDLVEHVVNTISGAEPVQISEPDERTKTKELIVPSQATAIDSGSTTSETKKVVLIEDNPVDAKLITRILQMKLPISIIPVSDGQNAIKVIKEEKPQLIALDLNIPDKSGFQILQELKKDKELDNTPVIVITSRNLTALEKERLISNDVRSVWQKGELDREQLIAHVESELQF
ncbi:MAG TPA: response regulator, partial [Anaerolineae bacterium]|nr:response regulator [Anaerolineae bacterium]